MPTLEVRGASVHYERTGHGTPLVMLLPQSTGPRGRQDLIQGLARCYTVITCDQRGTGGSDPVPGELSMAALAEDVIGVLDAIDLKQVHLLCHSTGCGIGLCVAANAPQRVAGLVLAAPWTHADPHLLAMQTLRKAAARALDPEQYARFNTALLFPPAFRRADTAGFDRLAAEAGLHPQDAEDFARRLDAILAFDARAVWPQIRCPTLVTVAEDDQLMPPWFAADTAKGIRGARLVEFDGGGHMLPETRTDEFVTAALAFLAEVDGQGRSD